MHQKFRIFIATFMLVLGYSAAHSQTDNLLSPELFSQKYQENIGAPLIDVRTPDEYADGHLPGALNFNWNGSEFENQIATLDKSQPVFVYCLSGGRSARAVAKMRAQGFDRVYELSGGILNWRSENFPEEAVNSESSPEMTMQDFKNKLQSDKLVLIDFFAEWCIPCKKMEPYLKEIAEEKADIVKIIRIDADKNKELCKELEVTALPYLRLYRQNELIWENTGYLGKQEVLQQLQKL